MEIQRINNTNLKKYGNHIEQAVKLYINIFSEPSYLEKFNFQEVKIEFLEYVNEGCLLLSIKDEVVIGFMASSFGLNYVCDSSFIEEANQSGFDCQKDVYISELGVSKEYRGLKVGKELVNRFMEIFDKDNIFLRTGVENNDFVINFYKKYGFHITNIRENVKNLRCDRTIVEDERLYMFRPKPLKYEFDLVNNHSQHSKTHHGHIRHHSGSEYLYGTHGHYDGEPSLMTGGYSSGSEGLYG
jgi:GNAT superfamily N-acetyltransferase